MILSTLIVIILAKLRLYDIPSHLIKWITTFIKNKPQIILVNGKPSFIARILRIYNKGQFLGRYEIYYICINDIRHFVMHSQVKFFADKQRIFNVIDCV